MSEQHINASKVFEKQSVECLEEQSSYVIIPKIKNENLEEMTWESTTADFELFKLLLSGWGVIELRLNAIKQFKDKDFADALVKRAQQKRKDFAKAQQQLKSVELDYLFMHEIHALIDAELVELGEKFYLPILRDLWKNKISTQVLEAKF